MKTTMTKPITPEQLQALQTALRGIGINERTDRLEYLSSQLGRVIGSTKDLTLEEAKWLLHCLNRNRADKKVKDMLRREAARIVGDIYHLSFLIPFLNEDYSESNTPEDVEMNKAKISVWTRKYAKCHKPISQMDVNELKDVREQMQTIIGKKNKEEK